ncbi:MAG: tetratricopeptide repeat protein, partial [Cyclobacteriaceae bacterium]|nr:tetratricopeptide repeat protein [Cyclobacteriaceae bacterium]
IHEGEMVFEGNDVLGDGVNIASRLQDDTQDGCITISASVYRDIKNKSDIKTEFIGEKSFKNVDELIKVYKVVCEERPVSESPPENLKNSHDYRKSRIILPSVNRMTVFIAVFIVVVAILVYPKIFSKDKFEGIRDPDGRISIAVMLFNNLTGDTLLNVWQEGLQNLFITSLSNSEELSVRQYETMSKIFKSKGNIHYSSITPSIASDIALKLEAKTVIVGNIHKSGNKVRVTTNLLNSRSKEIYKSYEIDGNIEDDFFTIIDSLSTLVKNYLEIKMLEHDIFYDLKDSYTKSAKAYKYYIQGFNYHGKLDYNSAIELYTKAIDIDTNFVSAMLLLSYSYGDIGQSEQSKTWANKAYERINRVPYNIQLTIKEVKAAIDKKPKEQIEYMKQYLEINPYSMNKMYTIGWAYYNTEQWQDAIDAFEKNLELNKQFGQKSWVWTYILLGRAYHEIGEHKKEQKIFEDVLDLLPDEESQITFWQAVCPLSQGDTTEAYEYLKKITEIGEQKDWSESEILYWLASVHDQANNFIKAEELYRRAVILNPHDTELMNDLAYLLISNDINIDEGIELIIRVLENKPDHGNYLHTYGLGLYKQGKLKESQEALNKAWDLIPYYNHDHFLHIQEVEKAVASQNK